MFARIAARRPDDAIFGEEGEASSGSSGVRWLVDPIDGTVNFVLGMPAYAVSVAAEIGGRVVAGCVHNPETGELFRATVGGGAYLGSRRLTGPRDVPLSRAVIGTGFSYDAARRGKQGDLVAAILPRIADIRRIGSASLDLCFVSAGRLDGYFEVGLNAWDWAAGALIAEEAGCVVSGLPDRPVGKPVVAAAGGSFAPDSSGSWRSLSRARSDRSALRLRRRWGRGVHGARWGDGGLGDVISGHRLLDGRGSTDHRELGAQSDLDLVVGSG